MSIITGGLGKGSKIITQGYGECYIVLAPSGGRGRPRPMRRYFKPIYDKSIRIPTKKKELLQNLKLLDYLGLLDYLDDISGLTLEELKQFIEKLEKEHKPLFEIFLEIFEKRLRKEKVEDPILREKLLKWLEEQQKRK